MKIKTEKDYIYKIKIYKNRCSKKCAHLKDITGYPKCILFCSWNIYEDKSRTQRIIYRNEQCMKVQEVK